MVVRWYYVDEMVEGVGGDSSCIRLRDIQLWPLGRGEYLTINYTAAPGRLRDSIRGIASASIRLPGPFADSCEYATDGREGLGRRAGRSIELT